MPMKWKNALFSGFCFGMAWLFAGGVQAQKPIGQYTSHIAGQKMQASSQSEVNTLGMRIHYLNVQGRFDIWGRIYALSLQGTRLEILRGLNIVRVPGFDFNLSTSFISFGGENCFDGDINGDPDLEYNVPWKVSPVLHGCTVLAKCSYSLDLGPAQIGLEAGTGLSYFYQYLFWEYGDPNDSSIILDGNIEREDAFKPVLEAALQVKLPLNEVHDLHVSFGGMMIPVFIRPRSTVLVSGIPFRTDDSMSLYKHDWIMQISAGWRIKF